MNLTSGLVLSPESCHTPKPIWTENRTSGKGTRVFPQKVPRQTASSSISFPSVLFKDLHVIAKEARLRMTELESPHFTIQPRRAFGIKFTYLNINKC